MQVSVLFSCPSVSLVTEAGITQTIKTKQMAEMKQQIPEIQR